MENVILEISSAANQTIKHIKALSSKKERQKSGEYTVEGTKSVNEAILSLKEIVHIVVSDTFDLSQLKENTSSLIRVPKTLFDKICDTENPQGVMAVLAQETNTLDTLEENGLYLYCDGISDPGNMGTLIRTAEAAGFDGILRSSSCVELYNPKTVRASMGSFFRMKVYDNIEPEKLEMYKKEGAVLFGGALLDETKDYRDVDYSKTSIIIVGNEANGISDEVLKLCTPIKIPIYGGAESLNAAVAAGIMMYEAANSRKN